MKPPTRSILLFDLPCIETCVTESNPNTPTALSLYVKKANGLCIVRHIAFKKTFS